MKEETRQIRSGPWGGRILRVDLTTGRVRADPTERFAGRWLGGRAINTWILLNEMDPKTKWFEPDNLLCFGNNRYSRNPFTLPFHNKKTRQIDKEHKEKAQKILERFKIDPDTYAGNLSYGQQKLVALGRILMKKSSLLLLDEPFAGIHTGFRKMIRDLLVDYTKNGNTVILIEHDISFISEFVEWVYLFVGGKRVTFGKIDEILSCEEVIKGIWGI